jgi:preprotein translocase subunit SecA
VGGRHDILEEYESLYQQGQMVERRRAERVQLENTGVLQEAAQSPPKAWEVLLGVGEARSSRRSQAAPVRMAGPPQKVGRNDPCPCGSGKKYKKCCGRRQ